MQGIWMYLGPIFSSEDINRQMPEEARNFRIVDSIWRQIMVYTVNNRRVLEATDYPNLLQLLNNCSVMFEQIQKGLNEYLEKKRLFFPRYSYFCDFFFFNLLLIIKQHTYIHIHK